MAAPAGGGGGAEANSERGFRAPEKGLFGV